MFSRTLFSVMTPAHHSSVQSFGGMFSDYFQSGRWKSLQLDCFNIRWQWCRVTSQQKNWYKSQLGPLSVELARSPHVCVGSFWVQRRAGVNVSVVV